MKNAIEKNAAYTTCFTIRRLHEPDGLHLAGSLGDALYDAALDSLYRTLTADQLADFLDRTAAVQSEDGMLRLLDDEGNPPPSDVRVAIWFQPTNAAAVLGIFTQLHYPELMNEARTKTLAGLLSGAVSRHFAGHGMDSRANFLQNMEIYIRAEAGRFIEQYPALCPAFTEFFADCIAQLRGDVIRADGEGRILTERDGFRTINVTEKIRQMLAWHDGLTRTVFVYGTLMLGQCANDLLKGGEYAGRFLLRDYAMYDLGRYPAIVPEDGETVIGEVWFVTDEMVERMDCYEGGQYERKSVEVDTLHGSITAETYCYADGIPAGSRVPVLMQPWNSRNKYVWYATYGTNLLESRMACYLQGGRCEQNGHTYPGCTDRSLWVDTNVWSFPGSLYFGNKSKSWENGGAAFYLPPAYRGSCSCLGGVVMKGYKITQEQLREVQQQEGTSENWYGRVYCIGLWTDGTPIITLTSGIRHPENSPCDAMIITMYRGLTECCGFGKTDAVRYLKYLLQKKDRHAFTQLAKTLQPPKRRKK